KVGTRGIPERSPTPPAKSRRGEAGLKTQPPRPAPRQRNRSELRTPTRRPKPHAWAEADWLWPRRRSLPAATLPKGSAGTANTSRGRGESEDRGKHSAPKIGHPARSAPAEHTA